MPPPITRPAADHGHHRGNPLRASRSSTSGWPEAATDRSAKSASVKFVGVVKLIVVDGHVRQGYGRDIARLGREQGSRRQPTRTNDLRFLRSLSYFEEEARNRLRRSEPSDGHPVRRARHIVRVQSRGNSSIEAGSPPCSPQTPILSPGTASRPCSTARRSRAPTPELIDRVERVGWEQTEIEVRRHHSGLDVITAETERQHCVRSFVPKEKKSASWAISPARSARPRRLNHRANGDVAVIRLCGLDLSFDPRSSERKLWSGDGQRGIITSTMGCSPASRQRLHRSPEVARTCIAYRPGLSTPRRTPRVPIIGLCSAHVRAARNSCCSTSDNPSVASFNVNSATGGKKLVQRRIEQAHP